MKFSNFSDSVMWDMLFRSMYVCTRKRILIKMVYMSNSKFLLKEIDYKKDRKMKIKKNKKRLKRDRCFASKIGKFKWKYQNLLQ